MNELFSITNIAFTVLDYNMSWVELVSTLLALAAVIGARLNSPWFYPLGILNSIGFIAIFHQVDLYSSLILNVYFIVMSIFGWIWWTRKGDCCRPALIIRKLPSGAMGRIMMIVLCFTMILSVNIDLLYGGIAEWLNVSYTNSKYPFLDALASVLSVAAMYLMAQRYVESWILWCIVDVICVALYFSQGVMFLSLIYGVFLLNAIVGWYQWDQISEKNFNKL